MNFLSNWQGEIKGFAIPWIDISLPVNWAVNTIIFSWGIADFLLLWKDSPALSFIPENYKKKVIEFIIRCQNNPEFWRGYDCWAFVREIVWVESFSSFVEISEWELFIGDVVYFNQFPEKDMDWVPFWGWVWHYAIYIYETDFTFQNFVQIEELLFAIVKR